MLGTLCAFLYFSYKFILKASQVTLEGLYAIKIAFYMTNFQ